MRINELLQVLALSTVIKVIDESDKTLFEGTAVKALNNNILKSIEIYNIEHNANNLIIRV